MHAPTQSQRLRAVLFRIWETSAQRQTITAEEFYRQAMEQIIAEQRRLLDPPYDDEQF